MRARELRQRNHPKHLHVQPKREHRPRPHPGRDHDRVLRIPRRDHIRLSQPNIPPQRRRIQRRSPRQEPTEQRDVRDIAVRDQMRERPERHRQRHRMPDRGADAVSGHVGGRDEHERDEHERGRHVPRPRRQHVQDRGLRARLAVAPDDRGEAGDRDQRVEALPRALAQPRDQLGAERLAPDPHRVEAEEENEKEWSEEDYLQGLRDSWNDVLSGRLQEDPEDAEALRVLKELERFTTKVDKRIEKERENLRSELELHSIEALREKTVETFLKTRANLLWLSEFRRAQLWLAVRQVNDHKAYYFTSRDEVDELPEEVLTILVRSYAELEVDTLEGKDSEEIPDSSPSPEQGPVAETVVSSSLSE